MKNKNGNPKGYRLYVITAAFIACCLAAVKGFAEERSVNVTPRVAVAISVDFQGIGASATVLQQSARNLAERINALEVHPDELTPEQLQAVTDMLAQSEKLMETLNLTLKEIPVSIEAAREPSVAMVSDLFTTAYQRSVEPTLAEIDSSVTKWLIILFIFALAIAALAGYGFYRGTRQLRSMAITLKSITQDYEIVRKRKE